MITRAPILWLVLMSLGCGGGAGDSRAEPNPAASGSSSGAGERHEAPTETTPDPDPTPSTAPPGVRIAVSVDPYERVALSIVNEGPEPSRFSSAVLLERASRSESAESFSVVEDLGAFAIGSELATDGCLELLPGGELRATWSCLRADAPDLVRDCTRAPAGEYRFVVRSCDGSARTDGTAFHYGG